MKITTKQEYGPTFDCELCGSHNDETYSVFLDDKKIYEYYTDNHMYTSYWPDSELPMWEIVLNEIALSLIQSIESSYTEDKRHEWNSKYPGNFIASTQEYWLEQKRINIEYIVEDIRLVRNIIKDSTPYESDLQIRLLVLWLEEHSIIVEYVNMGDGSEYTEN